TDASVPPFSHRLSVDAFSVPGNRDVSVTDSTPGITLSAAVNSSNNRALAAIDEYLSDRRLMATLCTLDHRFVRLSCPNSIHWEAKLLATKASAIDDASCPAIRPRTMVRVVV